MYFDPLGSVLAVFYAFALNKLLVFLNEHGFKLNGKDWSALFVSALVSATIGYLDAIGAKLPPDVQALLPFIVQTVIVWLGAIGIHGGAKFGVNVVKAALKIEA